jgi:hypothetical protein
VPNFGPAEAEEGYSEGFEGRYRSGIGQAAAEGTGLMEFPFL